MVIYISVYELFIGSVLNENNTEISPNKDSSIAVCIY